MLSQISAVIINATLMSSITLSLYWIKHQYNRLALFHRTYQEFYIVTEKMRKDIINAGFCGFCCIKPVHARRIISTMSIKDAQKIYNLRNKEYATGSDIILLYDVPRVIVKLEKDYTVYNHRIYLDTNNIYEDDEIILDDCRVSVKYKVVYKGAGVIGVKPKYSAGAFANYKFKKENTKLIVIQELYYYVAKNERKGYSLFRQNMKSKPEALLDNVQLFKIKPLRKNCYSIETTFPNKTLAFVISRGFIYGKNCSGKQNRNCCDDFITS